MRELFRLALPDADAAVPIPLTILLTLLVLWGVYYRFELPIIQIDKCLTPPQPQLGYAH